MTVCEQPFRDSLRDGALPRSGQPVQPVDGGLVEVPRPEFDPIQNGSARSFEATFALAVTMLGPIRVAKTIEGRLFSYQRFASEIRRRKRGTV